MTAIHKHCELNTPGLTKIDQLVERGSHRASRVEHIVYENDRSAGDIGRQFSLVDDRAISDSAQVVAVEGDVERSVATVTPLSSAILAASRSASGTPRRRIPTSNTLARSGLLSTTCDARRAMTRPMSADDMTMAFSLKCISGAFPGI
jgi:hypothetical protein